MFSCSNPFFCVASGGKLWPDMKWLTWSDSEFDKQILWGQVVFPPLRCTHVYNLCVSIRSQCWMQPPPWLQSKSMQSKQDMATIGMDGRRGRVFRRWGRWRVRRSITAGELKWVLGSENPSYHQVSIKKKKTKLSCVILFWINNHHVSQLNTRFDSEGVSIAKTGRCFS